MCQKLNLSDQNHAGFQVCEVQENGSGDLEAGLIPSFRTFETTWNIQKQLFQS